MNILNASFVFVALFASVLLALTTPIERGPSKVSVVMIGKRR